jgi:dTDP-4-dehydrorhamnose reductase
MNIVVTGSNGQLGHDIIKELSKRNHYNIYGVDQKDFDITVKQKCESYFSEVIPEVIIHCAAYTNVDQAEIEKEKCFNVNVQGTKNLVSIARKYGSKFIYISTDYVFDGNNENPYEIKDKTNPVSYYGYTKLEGEKEVKKYIKSTIFRISWAFGKNGNNFVKTMLKISNLKDEIAVISDQIGSPTYTLDVSKTIVDSIEKNKFGTFHATNQGTCSWYDFCLEIYRLVGVKKKIKAISSSEYKSLARRPKNSILSKNSLLANDLDLLPHWKDALKRYLKEIEVIK